MAEPKMVQTELAAKTLQKLPELAVVEISRLHFDPIDSIPVETAWVNDQLAFNDASFRQIADKMEKWYDTKIEFSAGNLEMLRFTGKFEKETLDQALEALQFTTPFRYRRQGKTIVIYQ
jgi:ferric-dicitrate binding protein FerR (iron transport regulator)